jgi:di/tricarboxylate transporter
VTSGDEDEDDEDKAGPLVGQTLAELERKLARPVPVSGIVRDGKAVETDPDLELRAGDRILLRDTPSGLQEIATTFGVDLYNRDGAGRFVEKDPRQGDMHLVEVVISPQSDLIGRTLRSAHFAARNRVVVVGLNHSAESLLPRVTDIANQRLSASDILLVQGPSDRITELGRIPGLLVLDERLMLPRSKLAPIALAIMAGVVIAAATKWLPIHVAAFLGVLAMLFTGCVRLDGVGRALSLEVILLVASSVALGQALLVTGAAAWVAAGVSALIDGMPAALQVAAFIGFAAALTNFVSNAAAAAVGTPIAVATAQSLGLPVDPFVLAILFGANLSFATPVAYQTNVLVMNAAGYRFSDFVKVGVPLVLIMLTTFSVLLARRYGL